jgi:ATP-dependent RNA helicase HelY
MYRPKKHFLRAKHPPSKKFKASRLKPAADSGLKKIFAEIGVPESQPFIPDPFQLQALSAVEHTDCLVTAPTGAGKTWIAQKAIARIHAGGGKSWYACPLKALSNAKYSEFASIFGTEQVGILTGDRKENPEAAVIVGTTEILRNQLYDAMHRGQSLSADFIVLDEAHFLGDEERGVVWEEIMIYLPVRVPLLLLSATIGNADQIAGWLTSIRSKPCTVIAATTRPVPLFPLFLHPSGKLLPLTEPTQRPGPKKMHAKVSEFIKTRKARRPALSAGLPSFDGILRVLKRFQLLPAIFFLKSRADCDQALDQCRGNPPIDPRRQAQIKKKMAPFIEQSRHISEHRQLWHLKNLAIGAHHSGQLPSWKLLLERLMTVGLLDAVFATSTVSAGVNFPARTVVFFNSDRFDGKQFKPLNATEFHQMTGRAGRRGMDNIGFALLVPNKFMDTRWITRLLNSPPSEVVSQIRINFSMVLNLLLSHRPDQIEELLEKSFAAYLIRKAKNRIHIQNSLVDLWSDFLRHFRFLKQKGYVTGRDELSADGFWASQLRVDQPLVIAEGLRLGLFPSPDPALLAGIIAAFVNEREFSERGAGKVLPKNLLKAYVAATRGLRPFEREMREHGFEVKPLFWRPSAAVHAWAAGQSWEKALELAETEEGDLAMLILRTADNLRHISTLKAVFPEAAQTAAASIGLILREPVVYY